MGVIPAARTPSRFVARTVTVAALACGLLACADDDSDRDATPSSTAPSSTTSVPGTTAPEPTTTATTTTIEPNEVDDVSVTWCAPAQRVRDASDRFDTVSTDPDEVRLVVTELLDALHAAAEVAPDELVEHVAVSVAGAVELDRALAETEYDILTADLSAFAEQTLAIEAANVVIRAYNVDVCGFEPRVDTEEHEDDDGFDLGDGSLRDQFVEQLLADGFTVDEADCIFGEIDFSDPDSFSTDEAIIEVFVACGLDLERIGELNSPG